MSKVLGAGPWAPGAAPICCKRRQSGRAGGCGPLADESKGGAAPESKRTRQQRTNEEHPIGAARNDN
eukprot:10107140-Alexandrium_andersonii.AAC.1